MAFFRKEQNQSPREKAQTATMAIVARLAGCAYLMYIVFTLVRDAGKEGNGLSIPATYIIAGLMGAAALAVVILTIKDFTRGIKERRFDSDRYYDEEFMRQGFTAEEIQDMRDKADETGASVEELIREAEIRKLVKESEQPAEIAEETEDAD